MKVVEYTLTANGEVPSFVIDGGYFGTPNGNGSPQDWTLIGVATDDAPGVVYATEQELADHLSVVGADWLVHNPQDDSYTPFDPVASASLLWAKLNQ
jgi:hypothetical protein